MSKPKILIVDDKPENLKALRKVLEDLDIELVEATSGNDALKATLRHDFVLALIDIQMPEMDGYELAGILREEEKTAHLPFIFISAVYKDNLFIFKGYENGAFSFITKPFQPEILINKVKFFIEKHQQEVALYELNEELQNSNKELEAFSYSVSHDLRAPLRAINGYAEILNEDYGSKLDDEGKRIIDIIRDNATRMGILIDVLLSFSRLGRKEIQMTEIDMNKMTEEVMVELNKSTTHNAKIKIGKLHEVKADYGLLRQVMINLISNAVKYSSKKKNPVVEISSEEKNGEIIFSVKDNGAGFDMRYADKLFGVFQRLHSQDEFEGTGVGLAIVQRIISRHEGKSWAEGTVNEGAVFYFSIIKN
ncbi:response regulator [Flavobacterium franklandianum]|uniref:sensor histidine kinase n=1 Tax=Flavobacterium franklandianum TaxID=2594430 RepID=UPI00117B7976|nr:response regulator [Flavobacterium franklandianum]TRX29382.1 response regulator [Flavobacterium franklandianum]